MTSREPRTASRMTGIYRASSRVSIGPGRARDRFGGRRRLGGESRSVLDTLNILGEELE